MESASTILVFLGWSIVGVALNLGAALLPPHRSRQQIAASVGAVALTSAALVIPFVTKGHPFFRSLIAQGLIVQTWRVLEILRTPDQFRRRERVLRVLLIPFEFAFLERTDRRIPWRELALSTLLLAVGAGGLLLSSWLAPPTPPYASNGWPRWLAATVGGYFVMEGMTLQWVSFLPLFGWSHRPYQRHPILSRTIAEFWGVRWSSVIHRWLRKNVYEPFARRGMPRLGITAAFVWSGLLHAYVVWPAAGPAAALWMLAFFSVHGFMMIVESRLKVRRWPTIAARAFVIAVFAATVPLFMEAILRAIGL